MVAMCYRCQPGIGSAEDSVPPGHCHTDEYASQHAEPPRLNSYPISTAYGNDNNCPTELSPVTADDETVFYKYEVDEDTHEQQEMAFFLLMTVITDHDDDKAVFFHGF